MKIRPIPGTAKKRTLKLQPSLDYLVPPDLSALIRANAHHDCVDGVIHLDPNNPSDRELWEDDELIPLPKP